MKERFDKDILPNNFTKLEGNFLPTFAKILKYSNMANVPFHLLLPIKII
jgi:hypothetical protein